MLRSKEWSSPDVSFRIETNCFGGNGRFHSWCKVQREAMQSIVFIFSIKNGSADVCACNKSSRCVLGSPAVSVELLRRRGVRTGCAVLARAGGCQRRVPGGCQRPCPVVSRRGLPAALGGRGAPDLRRSCVLQLPERITLWKPLVEMRWPISGAPQAPRSPAANFTARAGHAPSSTGSL